MHFKQNIQALAHNVDPKALAAMYSVTSSDAYPDFTAVILAETSTTDTFMPTYPRRYFQSRMETWYI